MFGPLADPASPGGSLGLVFAFVVLPTIIFVASMFAVLYYLGVMQRVVELFARAFRRFLKVSGRRERERGRQRAHGPDRGAPDHPPVPGRITRSELMVVMTAGMAHVSGASWWPTSRWRGWTWCTCSPP